MSLRGVNPLQHCKSQTGSQVPATRKVAVRDFMTADVVPVTLACWRADLGVMQAAASGL